MSIKHSFIKIIGIFWLFLGSVGFATAADADRFIVQVWSNPVIVNEPVDLTVKVVDKNSDIVKDYIDKDIYMTIDGLKDSDYTMPSDGIYTFQKNDQWNKVFSKWLTIKKAWEYTIKVYEVLNEKIIWQASIKVVVNAWADSSKIWIDSPINWSTETETSIAVLWHSQFPNTPIIVFLNNRQVKTTITDPQWGFNVFLDSVANGQHVLMAQAIDTENNVLWQSADTKFTRAGDHNLSYKSINYDPGKIINQWEKIKISIETDISASNAVLDLGWLWSFVMDKITPGKFEKSIKANSAWTFPVSLKVTNNWSELSDSWIDNITVNAVSNTDIKNIKIVRNSINQVNISRETSCIAAKYVINYWDTANDLNSSSSTKTKSVTLDLTSKKDHYVNIIPMDANNNMICKPSATFKIEKDENLNASAWNNNNCVIQWISISQTTSNGKHFITWNKLDNVDRYIIYKSDATTNSFDQMNLVWETSDNYFQIPFDNTTKTVSYSNYAVQAVCKDWTKSNASLSGRVQVGMADNVMYIVTIVIMMYLWYKLAKN